MYQKLATILDTYSSNQRLLDKNALEDIASISIQGNKKLAPYIKDIIIIPKGKPRTLATYHYEDKIIKVYIDYIYQVLSKIFGENNYYRKNEEIMQTLLHEVCHGEQNSIANSDREDLECNIIRACILSLKDEAYYLKNNLICPTERMAEIDSLLQMMSIGVISHNNHELEYFRKINREMHLGYSKNLKSSPTEKYIQEAFIDSYFKFSRRALEEIKKIYSLEQRLRLGLQVTKSEFNKELDPFFTLERLRNRR